MKHALVLTEIGICGKGFSERLIDYSTQAISDAHPIQDDRIFSLTNVICQETHEDREYRYLLNLSLQHFSQDNNLTSSYIT